ncbi:hypothetical protein [Actinotalea sp. K2]|uniref:hypothetical protein n=1 Tax=Actinotalea sp. K2 TaxID=2939438 RepID=UPI00201837EB|nr:hypothetical protein [Actinotalea sp. K2]MCL3860883.1 hypothetical protein [Actinotalea sp. K2]
MDDRRERASMAASMDPGAGINGSIGVAAPIGAVSRKDRERARRTSLLREGTADLLLLTALPGSVSLQRRGADGTWETLDRRPASRRGRTRIELPEQGTSPPQVLRVVFSPKNPNITSWISGDIGD